MFQAPQLRPVSDLPARLLASFPPLPAEPGSAFLVTGEGEFEGRRFRVGEILLCRGVARPGHHTVLVAKGFGRPRLGSVTGDVLRGDGGEVCHPARWTPRGQLVARMRRSADGWITELLVSGARPVGEGGRAAAGARGERAPAAQLPLFAA